VIGLLLLVGAATAGLDGETPFEAAQRSFADAAACKAFLAARATEARGQDYDAVEGPYELAAGDVRIHTVRADGNGHRIVEQRCLGTALSARSWRRSLEEDEEAFTVESAARSAPWLKKAPGR
jgi:hypothetical protein